MKALVTAVALGAVIASPAFARTAVSQQQQAGYTSYNQQIVPGFVPHTGQVVVNGHIVGKDPDPRVRLMMRLDPPTDDYGR
jgi:hypothetical protein